MRAASALPCTICAHHKSVCWVEVLIEPIQFRSMKVTSGQSTSRILNNVDKKPVIWALLDQIGLHSEKKQKGECPISKNSIWRAIEILSEDEIADTDFLCLSFFCFFLCMSKCATFVFAKVGKHARILMLQCFQANTTFCKLCRNSNFEN